MPPSNVGQQLDACCFEEQWFRVSTIACPTGYLIKSSGVVNADQNQRVEQHPRHLPFFR
jgi:hypothetical protein